MSLPRRVLALVVQTATWFQLPRQTPVLGELLGQEDRVEVTSAKQW